MRDQSLDRTDKQLLAILDDPGVWIVSGWVENGPTTQQLCRTATLRLALLRATDFAASGAVIMTVRRRSTEGIDILSGQIDRLTKTIAGD